MSQQLTPADIRFLPGKSKTNIRRHISFPIHKDLVAHLDAVNIVGLRRYVLMEYLILRGLEAVTEEAQKTGKTEVPISHDDIERLVEQLPRQN